MKEGREEITFIYFFFSRGILIYVFSRASVIGINTPIITDKEANTQKGQLSQGKNHAKGMI